MSDKLPIDEVDEIDPTTHLKGEQKYESLEEAQAQAADVTKAIEEKKKNNDLLGALEIAMGFVKKLVPIPGL